MNALNKNNLTLARILTRRSEWSFSSGGFNAGRSIRSEFLDIFNSLIEHPIVNEGFDFVCDTRFTAIAKQRINRGKCSRYPESFFTSSELCDEAYALLSLMKLHIWYTMAEELSDFPNMTFNDDWGIFSPHQLPRIKLLVELLGLIDFLHLANALDSRSFIYDAKQAIDKKLEAAYPDDF